MDFDSAYKYVIERLSHELPKGLFYHGIHHTLDVLQFAETIAAMEDLKDTDMTILKTAALYHDTGFIIRYKNNEPEACKIAKATLPKFGYNTKQIKTICDMIMATAMPQNPQSHLAEILCDADLNYLGTENYYSIAETFRDELAGQGVKFSEEAWLKLQLDFLSKHKYFTAAAKKLRNEKKNKYILELENKI
jgi:predicted metal-dependent HD superfamily phosphohydrolase